LRNSSFPAQQRGYFSGEQRQRGNIPVQRTERDVAAFAPLQCGYGMAVPHRSIRIRQHQYA
jgi:hypothetical protein